MNTLALVQHENLKMGRIKKRIGTNKRICEKQNETCNNYNFYAVTTEITRTYEVFSTIVHNKLRMKNT